MKCCFVVITLALFLGITGLTNGLTWELSDFIGEYETTRSADAIIAQEQLIDFGSPITPVESIRFEFSGSIVLPQHINEEQEIISIPILSNYSFMDQNNTGIITGIGLRNSSYAHNSGPVGNWSEVLREYNVNNNIFDYSITFFTEDSDFYLESIYNQIIFSDSYPPYHNYPLHQPGNVNITSATFSVEIPEPTSLLLLGLGGLMLRRKYRR